MDLQDDHVTCHCQPALPSDSYQLAQCEGQSSHDQKMDHGSQARVVLFAVSLLEGLLWGLPLSFGVFEDFYSRESQFKGNPYLPIIGTLSTCTLYLGSPLMCVLVNTCPRYKRHMVWAGWLISILSLIGASFARTAPVLMMTQGIFYSSGVLVLYIPVMEIVHEWFLGKRGLAYGVMTCSTGITGAIYPFVLQAMLDRFGAPTTLRAVAVFFFVVVGPCLPLVRGRPHQCPAPAPYSTFLSQYTDLLHQPHFYFYSMSNILQGLAFFIPTIFLPSYASAVGMDATLGALLVALLSIGQILGQLTFGLLADGRLPHHLLLVSSSLVSAIATFMLWGFAHGIALLAVFAVVYGFFASSYVVMWAPMGISLSPKSGVRLMVFSIFCAQRGLGNVIAGPLCSKLKERSSTITDSYGMGSFAGVVFLTGGSMLLSALSVAVLYIPCRKRGRHCQSTQAVVQQLGCG